MAKKFLDNKRIKGILFDLDGTIINSKRFHKKAWKLTCKQNGFEITKEELKMQEGRDAVEASKIILKNHELKINAKKFAKQKHENFLKIFKPKFFPMIVNTLKKLKTKYKIGLCTSANNDLIKKVFTEELIQLFDVIIKSGDYKNGKPSEEPIIMASKKIGLNLNEIAYVGDSYNDYLASKNCAIFFHFCPNKCEDMKLKRKNYVKIKNFKELLKILS